jgi:peptidoglycan/LPS O-acetylase OafA/YrhL
MAADVYARLSGAAAAGRRSPRRDPRGRGVALVVAASLPLALASWLVVERPLLRRTSRWWRRRRATPRPRAAAASR